ncbi:hypothetical protein [Crossiella cryophila]|uniref:Uncharacterized protein n=1 Tax=Crossiella cryophila TaxID=43355 RepID=A0A7W7CHD5_9PSEU|nr:hypothetical protein [Crossiella cryophila]MBB4680987.1 hypothetical protein [Crossiella cryophila]
MIWCPGCRCWSRRTEYIGTDYRVAEPRLRRDGPKAVLDLPLRQVTRLHAIERPEQVLAIIEAASRRKAAP